MNIGPVIGLSGSLLLPPPGDGEPMVESVIGPELHPGLDPGLVHTLDLLRTTAIRELNAHRGRGGVCITCGAQWPCERARLAEHNLAVL